MGDESIDLSRTVICERASGQRKRVAGVYHIIDKNRDLVPNISDEDFHLLRSVVLLPLPLAVDQRELDAQLIRNGRHPANYVSMTARVDHCGHAGDRTEPKPARTTARSMECWCAFHIFTFSHVVRLPEQVTCRLGRPSLLRMPDEMNTHRFAPPASGLTMILSLQPSMFLLMYEIMSGSE